MAAKISIVIPSYNQALFLERAIVSVLNQQWPNLELIVMDGGSTDGSVDILRQYDSQLTYWESVPDRGQSHALNKGFERATGDLFGWLNADDTYCDGMFEVLSQVFLTRPSVQVVFGDWFQIDTDDLVTDYCYAFDYNYRHLVYEGFHLSTQAMLWRAGLHRQFGVFQEDLHRTMDYDFLIRLGQLCGNRGFFRVAQPFCCFRRHEAQKTHMFDDALARELAYIYATHGHERYRELWRVFFRFRRLWWYVRRGGLRYMSRRILERFSL